METDADMARPSVSIGERAEAKKNPPTEPLRQLEGDGVTVAWPVLDPLNVDRVSVFLDYRRIDLSAQELRFLCVNAPTILGWLEATDGS